MYFSSVVRSLQNFFDPFVIWILGDYLKNDMSKMIDNFTNIPHILLKIG
ncbi:hypothetical protein P689_122283 [Candidatus Riesia pediculischaeffi PTSU]|uniref:Uncharacterized protein n=1 Tax=Candidatus Riesia pediculischaeffi PTSU TaxID=1401651 RepID=A0A0C1S988_9ENTR|nr:hypothetical protein P689_122283 [Candidatus Riesia pediculischaeffi PTSU]